MKQSFFIFLLTILLIQGHAQDANITLRQAQYNLSCSKLAIEGFDPVSYFSGKPKKGDAAYTVQYSGVAYYFASLQNKEAFQKTPFKYEPQNGGWCAYAIGSYGSKVEVDPETYKILDGKLYLFYSSFFNNTLKSWNRAEAMLMKNADASWEKFYH